MRNIKQIAELLGYHSKYLIFRNLYFVNQYGFSYIHATLGYLLKFRASRAFNISKPVHLTDFTFPALNTCKQNFKFTAGFRTSSSTAGVPSNTGRSTGAVDSVVVEFRNLPNGKRPRHGPRHGSTASSYPGTLPGDRRPENICVPDGDEHIEYAELFRPKTKCDDGTVYVSATGATPGESVREYVTALHELVANCNFGQVSDELIRDQLIEKTNNPRVRERLLM